MIFPNEIVSEILAHASKLDLKAARLVCEAWRYAASRYLFNTIYISPRKEDIDVFTAITRHPDLRSCPQSIEYDATYFKSVSTKSDYIKLLYRQFTLQYNVTSQSTLHQLALLSPDAQINDFAKMSKVMPLESLEKRCAGYDFVNLGHRKYTECADYVQWCIFSGDFFRVLVSGLRGLDRLESANLNRPWTAWSVDLDDRNVYPTPFGRSWSAFYIQPFRCSVRHPRFYCEGGITKETGFDEFWVLVRALSLIERKLKRLHLSEIPSSVFAATEDVPSKLIDGRVDIFSKVEDLNLALADNIKSTPLPDHQFPDLGTILKSMTQLRSLSLSLPPTTSTDEAFFTQCQVFPAQGPWLNLKSLILYNMKTTAKGLAQLLTRNMPNLEIVFLNHVILHDGSWESVVECVRTSTRLNFFYHHFKRAKLPLEYNRALLHLGSQTSTDPDSLDIKNRFTSEIGNYVVNGGRHPCLLPEEPSSASKGIWQSSGLDTMSSSHVLCTYCVS